MIARPTLWGRRPLASILTRWTLSLLVLVISLQPLEARGVQPQPGDERIVAACITRSSSGRAWLEKTLWGLRDQEGGWIGAEVANSDGSYDLGPLQVNSWWVPRLASLTGRPERHIRQWLKQDACFNVEAARWIFLSGLAATRDYWRAIGRYHSPTMWRQNRYAQNVVLRLKHRFGPRIFQKPQRAMESSTADSVKYGGGTNDRYLSSSVAKDNPR